MITVEDYIYLPFTPDLIRGSLSHAIHLLPYIHTQFADEVYQKFQHLAEATAVELALRRFLSQQNIPFVVQKSLSFAHHDQYDIFMAGRRLMLQVLQFENDLPLDLLSTQVILPSEHHRTIEPSGRNMYLFAVIVKSKPKTIMNGRYLLHILPGFWRQPQKWNPLGGLTCKYAGLARIKLEITGQLANQEIFSSRINLDPGEQAVIQVRYYSISSVHVDQTPADLIGIKSPERKKVYLIQPDQWRDVWLAGSRVILIGTIGFEEFTHRSTLIRPGVKIIPYGSIDEKSMGFPIRELKPVGALFDQAGIHNPIKTFSA